MAEKQEHAPGPTPGPCKYGSDICHCGDFRSQHKDWQYGCLTRNCDCWSFIFKERRRRLVPLQITRKSRYLGKSQKA